jgi:hypothetical protein
MRVNFSSLNWLELLVFANQSTCGYAVAPWFSSLLQQNILNRVELKRRSIQS